MRISLIAALGTNWVIGNKGKLPWHLPADMKRFRQLTRGHTVLMGRKTAKSLKWKPLKNRVNLVLTRTMNHPEVPRGFAVVKQINDEANIAEMCGETELFIIGGAQIFTLAERGVDRMYLTIINADFEGDATFPIDFVDEENWDLVQSEKRPPDAKNPYELYFTVWDRIRKK